MVLKSHFRLLIFSRQPRKNMQKLAILIIIAICCVWEREKKVLIFFLRKACNMTLKGHKKTGFLCIVWPMMLLQPMEGNSKNYVKDQTSTFSAIYQFPMKYILYRLIFEQTFLKTCKNISLSWKKNALKEIASQLRQNSRHSWGWFLYRFYFESIYII